MIIGGQEFPEECPENCPRKDDFIKYGQSALCGRCPIFNCTGTFTLLRPEQYRPDWALAWRKWFDEGMQGLPELLLGPVENLGGDDGENTSGEEESGPSENACQDFCQGKNSCCGQDICGQTGSCSDKNTDDKESGPGGR